MHAVFSHTGTGLTVLFEDQILNYVYLYSSTLYIWASLVAQMVKNLPAVILVMGRILYTEHMCEALTPGTLERDLFGCKAVANLIS